MIGEVVAAVYERTKRSRWVWVILAALAVTLSLWSASRARFSLDLFDALPPDPGIIRYQALFESAAGETDRMIIGFYSDDPIPTDSLAISAQRFAAGMYERSREIIRHLVIDPDPGLMDEAASEIMHHLPIYADSVALAKAATMDSTAVDSLFKSIRNALSAPGAEMALVQRMKDPLGLIGPTLERVINSASLSGITLVHGQLFTADSSMALVMYTPAKEAASDDRKLVEAINEHIASAVHDPIQGSAFGAVPMSVANRARITEDSILTSSITVVFVLVLLYWRYSNKRIPVLFLVPALLGFIFGVGVTAAFRPVISALALGGSAALLGIALDYCFHFFTHLKYRRDIATTLKEVASPMLLGSITTMLAFGALSFASSRVLADLGTIAAFMLIGASFSVLFLLPHFSNVPNEEETPIIEVTPPPRIKGVRWRLILVVIVSALLIPFIDQVEYDSDPEHLSYITPGMKRVRNALEGEADRPLNFFLSGSGSNEEEARQNLEATLDGIRNQDPHDPIARSSLPTDLWPSEASAVVRMERWNEAFDDGHGERLAGWFRVAAQRNGFRIAPFEPFLQQLTDPPSGRPDDVLRKFSGEIVASTGDEVMIAGRLSLPAQQITELEAAVANNDNVAVSHRGVLGSLVERSVRTDLDGILWRTSLIVFGILLITYGRIELALITFVPMALGWVWILGICGAAGIKFDLVNILVCTFVFGLGDDYCIFTSEGLLARYRTGSDHTKSFRQAVVLSAITTIIGTGTLILAQHPALRSIATLGVTGMIVLVVVALTVQPVLFELIIGGRVAKGKKPITAFSFFTTAIAFTIFFIGCITLMLFSLLLILVPVAHRHKRHWVRVGIMAFSRLLIYTMVNIRKDVKGFSNLVRHRPSIVIANHTSFIDILAMLMITPRAVMVVNHWVWNSPFFGPIVRYAGYLYTGDGMDVNEVKARKAVEQGLSVIVFPEGTRSPDGRIGRFHKGGFHLARTLNIPIVPVVLHGFHVAIPKGDALLSDTHVTMRTLDPLMPGDTSWGDDLRDRTKRIAAWFKQQHETLRRARETPRWFHDRLIRAFTYKGPVLEWHTRTKVRMDLKLHEYLHQQIPADAKVVDLGSGHGVLSFLLHWSGPARVIQGFERDEEKVAISEHVIGKGERLTFAQADLEELEPPPAYAYLLKDVLHYLSPEHQQRLINVCVAALEPGGAIYVRDGFVAEGTQHRRTELTERISTGIGFNKPKGALHFISKEELIRMAEIAGAHVEWVMRDMRTSNELAVLKAGR